MSRYSIIEQLTSQKLDIISAKSNLDSDITGKNQAVDAAKAEFKDWEKNIKADVEKMRQEQQRNIDKLQREADNAKERKKIKEKTYDIKIKAIDDALKQIQKISETAGKE